MPHKYIEKSILNPPQWLEAMRADDPCLFQMLSEALVARDHAIEAGAQRDPRSHAALRAGDATIDQIAFGRYKSPVACRKAADALRKYTQALDAMFPETHTS